MSTPFDEKGFLARVATLIGSSSEDETLKAVRATLTALRSELDDGDRAALAEVLPPAWLDSLRTSDEPHPSGRGEFFHRVQTAEHIPLAAAEEHAEAICRALGEKLPPAMLQRLDGVLPKTVDALFYRASRS